MTFGRALLPYASDRGSRRWTDEFMTGSMRPPVLVGATTEPSGTTVSSSTSSASTAPKTLVNDDATQIQPSRREITRPPATPAVLVNPAKPQAKEEPKKEEPPPREVEAKTDEELDEAIPSSSPLLPPSSRQPAPVAAAGPQWGIVALVALATLVVSYLFARYLR